MRLVKSTSDETACEISKLTENCMEAVRLSTQAAIEGITAAANSLRDITNAIVTLTTTQHEESMKTLRSLSDDNRRVMEKVLEDNYDEGNEDESDDSN
jgi:hypothetical protein